MKFDKGIVLERFQDVAKTRHGATDCCPGVLVLVRTRC